MKRAVIQIRQNDDEITALQAMGQGFAAAWNSGEVQNPTAVLTFSSPAQLFSVISPRRWELIERLQAIGPVSIRGLARALERDVKRVHEDVVALEEWGLVSRDTSGKILVPFEEIEADFVLKAAAA